MPNNPFKQIEYYKGNPDELQKKIEVSIDRTESLLRIAELFTGSAANVFLKLLDVNYKDNTDEQPTED